MRLAQNISDSLPGLSLLCPQGHRVQKVKGVQANWLCSNLAISVLARACQVVFFILFSREDTE